jgi:DNA modification methylase
MLIRDRIKELRRVPASDLLVNPGNWRVHPKAQAAALRGLLSEIGYADALLARELPDGRLQLVDGHLRAETTPSAIVPVLILDVTEEEADKILLTLDPLAGMAEGDSQRLQALLNNVRTDSPAVEQLFARIAEQDALILPRPVQILDPRPQLERAAELQKEWRTAPRQLWRIGPHRLVCGDSTNQADVAQLWRDGGPLVRVTWTDPPYGIDYVRSKNAALQQLHKGTRVKKNIANDALAPAETHAMFARALSLAVAHSTRGAACYATVAAGPLLAGFIQAFERAGFAFKHHLVWVKQQLVLGRCDYHYRHEPILYGWLENGPHYFCDDRTQDTVFQVDKPTTSELHPTTKPTELIARMIANSSRVGELVFDPFCGSGSTLVAAHPLGRVSYGVELDPAYVAVTLERLAALGLGPSWESNMPNRPRNSDGTHRKANQPRLMTNRSTTAR